MRAAKGGAKQWDVSQMALFVSTIPFYGYTDFYKQQFVENGVDGQKFLSASQKDLHGWGVESVAHCARLLAEINRFKMA